MNIKPTNIGLSMQAKVRSPNIVTTPEINAKFLNGEIGAILDWQVRDSKSGKLISEGIRKAESFTRQFFDLLLVCFQDAQPYQPLQILSTSNILEEGVVNSKYTLNTDALAGDVLYGIIVGTGNAAPTITDYVLQTPIAHGVAAGQLQYSIVTWGADTADATTSQFTITRNFANASGGAITVNEVGLYVKAAWLKLNNRIYIEGYATKYFMTIRDVIAGGIAVANGQTLTINYRPQTVV